MSTGSVMQFADDMLSKSAFLQEYCSDQKIYRDPGEELPLSMLGYFGKEIASHYEAIAPAELRIILHMIEQGVQSRDSDIGDAVATGLIEGMIHRAEGIEGKWEKMEADLGPEARKYADAYLAWSGDVKRTTTTPPPVKTGT